MILKIYTKKLKYKYKVHINIKKEPTGEFNLWLKKFVNKQIS